LPEDLDDAQLEALLFPPPPAIGVPSVKAALQSAGGGGRMLAWN